MDVLHALLTRRSIYQFQPGREVPDSVLDEAVNAACHAPNHKLTEPWRFFIAGPDTRKRLGEISRRAKLAGTADMPADRRAMLEQKAEQAAADVAGLSALIAVTSLKTPGDAFREREDYAATCCAIENLMLALWAHGVGSQWSTGAATRDAETYEVLGVDPAVEEIIGFVKIGWPDGELPAARRSRIGEAARRLP